MGYIINTIKAIFGKTESYELDEQKLSPEERETLKKIKELDKTEKIENSFIKSLQKEMKERNERKNFEKGVRDRIEMDQEKIYGSPEKYKIKQEREER